MNSAGHCTAWQGPHGGLAQTGFDVAQPVGTAALLIALGVAALVKFRRPSRRH